MKGTVTQEETFPLTHDREKEIRDRLAEIKTEQEQLKVDAHILGTKLAENHHCFAHQQRVIYKGKLAVVDYNPDQAGSDVAPLRIRVDNVDPTKRPMFRFVKADELTKWRES